MSRRQPELDWNKVSFLIFTTMGGDRVVRIFCDHPELTYNEFWYGKNRLHFAGVNEPPEGHEQVHLKGDAACRAVEAYLDRGEVPTVGNTAPVSVNEQKKEQSDLGLRVGVVIIGILVTCALLYMIGYRRTGPYIAFSILSGFIFYFWELTIILIIVSIGGIIAYSWLF